ncbi:MAG: hypothetical protein O7A06_16840 [Acidobacteria bacterium]|nr:hypothetical protein [Acidobacteriota bacterium]MCZ6751058.1 hypothetical protein [Acidobacteriota bacterium]
MPRAYRIAYRSFDRQWLLLDNRPGDYLRPDLWHAHSEQQVYLTTSLTEPMGTGPALTATNLIPLRPARANCFPLPPRVISR